MFKSVLKNHERIDTLIGAGTKVKGDVLFSGGLRVDGEIEGNVTAASESSGALVISEKARIEGSVAVPHVLVNGTVVGPISSASLLELQSKARVSGDVEYNRVEMHLGAVVEGRLIHAAAPGKAVELKLANTHLGNGN